MGNMHLVTGYQGYEHVTAADHGSLYAAIFGNGSYVLDRGNKLAATVITNNQIRIADGDIVLQGRHMRLNEGASVDLTIENGAQGYRRHDLIVARYTRNAATGIEEASIIVIKGTPTASDPADPEYIYGDILSDHAETADFPLYRIVLDGISVGTPVPLFDVAYLVTLGSDKKIPSAYLPSMNYIPTSQKGAANGVATLGSDKKIPSSQLPSMNYIPTSQKGAANGVASLDANKKIAHSAIPYTSYEVTTFEKVEGHEELDGVNLTFTRVGDIVVVSGSVWMKGYSNGPAKVLIEGIPASDAVSVALCGNSAKYECDIHLDRKSSSSFMSAYLTVRRTGTVDMNESIAVGGCYLYVQ